MEEKILNETTTFCESCQSRECCPEEECVLYRIEQIIVGKKDKEEPLKGQMTIYDVSNKNI